MDDAGTGAAGMDPGSMDDAGFVDFCYRRILGRAPDDAGRRWYENALGTREITREQLLLDLLTSEEFEKAYGAREFVPAGHFYSALPSSETRKKFIRSGADVNAIPGVDLRYEAQVTLLERFFPLCRECPFPESEIGEYRFYFENGFYSYTDALTLYGMMREFRPRRIVEIGSGFSSAVMLDTNDEYFDGGIEMTFIEPYPEILRSLFRKEDQRHTIHQTALQDVPAAVFRRLEPSDILFVDSTHVSKLGSDVNRILFEILPMLAPGVLVHFHDIFWPFEYPKAWIAEGRAWNEAYVLRAFLQYNSAYEIVFFSDYLHRVRSGWIRTHMPRYLRNTGGNLWLRKAVRS